MKYILLFISSVYFFYIVNCGEECNYNFVDESIIGDVIFLHSNELDNVIVEEADPVILESQVGKLSRYGPDCYGCSGYLAYGDYVGDGRIYYNDKQYGKIRILAGDRKYEFGTVVRVNTATESFLAIVLDRGGAIGVGKIALFDLLYPSESLANIDGVSHNTSFEILRYGF